LYALAIVQCQHTYMIARGTIHRSVPCFSQGTRVMSPEGLSTTQCGESHNQHSERGVFCCSLYTDPMLKQYPAWLKGGIYGMCYGFALLALNLIISLFNAEKDFFILTVFYNPGIFLLGFPLLPSAFHTNTLLAFATIILGDFLIGAIVGIFLHWRRRRIAEGK
jgi:hypothetical protein